MSGASAQYVIVLRDLPVRICLTSYLADKFREKSFEVHASESQPGLLVVKASPFDLEVQAEHLRLRKTVSNGEFQEFDVSTRRSFRHIDTEQFWLPFEESYLTQTLLQLVRTDEAFKSVFSKAQLPLRPEEWQDQPVLEVCKRLKLLHYAGPLHLVEGRLAAWRGQRHRLLCVDLQPIRDYFGEQVAFYFAWMNCMNRWLLLPAALAAAMWVWPGSGPARHKQWSIPLYSAFMSVWGVVGAKMWRRTTHALAWQWDTEQRHRSEELRPAFKGRWRTSPVTNKPERYFSSLQRLPLYCLSGACTATLLALALLLICAMLNLQGYIQPGDPGIYIGLLGRWARPGQVFDPASPLNALALAIRIVLVVGFKLLVYIPCAEKLTHLENHKTTKAHRNSLFLKRYLYDAADRYTPLLYLAFFRSDLHKVHSELQVLYLVDIVRRVSMETLLPSLQVRRSTSSSNLKNMDSSSGGGSSSSVAGGSGKNGAAAAALLQAKAELSMPDYDEFDDWLEMIVEWGYITMFAAAYPPAALVSLLVNLVEVRSDLFKLTRVYRRPQVVRASSIGTWQGLIEVQAWMGVLTNTLMVAYKGPYLSYWLPTWFREAEVQGDGGGKAAAAAAGGPYLLDGRRLFVVLVLEHVLLLIMLFIFVTIKDVPEQVREARRRVEYLREQTYLSTQQQQRRSLLVAMSLKRRELEALLEQLDQEGGLSDPSDCSLSEPKPILRSHSKVDETDALQEALSSVAASDAWRLGVSGREGAPAGSGERGDSGGGLPVREQGIGLRLRERATARVLDGGAGARSCMSADAEHSAERKHVSWGLDRKAV